MIVRVQVIKVYDVEVPDECEDPHDYVYDLQIEEIETTGKLIDAMTDHAQTDEEMDEWVQISDG